MPNKNPLKKKKDPKQREVKPTPISLQPSAIKILEALDKDKGKTYSASINKAIEMKKPTKSSTGEAKKLKIWVAKKPILASPYEVVGQETLRLLSPTTQPKYRFWDDKGVIGVTSEKLPFTGIDKEQKNLFSPEFLKGLGAATLFSLFTNETDLKLDHIDTKTGMKIDGDWMFSSLISPERFATSSAITANEINCLPYVEKYNANNWLDQIENSKKTKGKLFSRLSPTDNTNLREGINQSIMHILLLPDQVIKNFVHAYINKTDAENKMSNFLIERKTQLLNASLQNKDFLEFLTQFKDTDKNTYLRKIRDFTHYKKHQLISEDSYVKIKNEVNTLLKTLQSQAKKIQSPKSDKDFEKLERKQTSPRKKK